MCSTRVLSLTLPLEMLLRQFYTRSVPQARSWRPAAELLLCTVIGSIVVKRFTFNVKPKSFVVLGCSHHSASTTVVYVGLRARRLADLFESFGFMQSNSQPTHVDVNTLDLVIARPDSCPVHCLVDPPKVISDNSLIVCQFFLPSCMLPTKNSSLSGLGRGIQYIFEGFCSMHRL